MYDPLETEHRRLSGGPMLASQQNAVLISMVSKECIVLSLYGISSTQI